MRRVVSVCGQWARRPSLGVRCRNGVWDGGGVGWGVEGSLRFYRSGVAATFDCFQRQKFFVSENVRGVGVGRPPPIASLFRYSVQSNPSRQFASVVSADDEDQNNEDEYDEVDDDDDDEIDDGTGVLQSSGFACVSTEVLITYRNAQFPVQATLYLPRSASRALGSSPSQRGPDTYADLIARACQILRLNEEDYCLHLRPTPPSQTQAQTTKDTAHQPAPVQALPERAQILWTHISQPTFVLKKKTSETSVRPFPPWLFDFTKPHLLFPTARKLKRKIIYHAGPTNSGKTHTALMALMAAPSGTYCGPLRLLAQEIYERLNSRNVPCHLITGQQHLDERGQRCHAHQTQVIDEFDENEESEAEESDTEIDPFDETPRQKRDEKGTSAEFLEMDGHFHFGEVLPNAQQAESWDESSPRPTTARHVSCTIEMLDLHRIVDVVVIDEIQMAGDRDRGWAWTRAVLGAPAPTIHLCGSVSAVGLVERMLKEAGETVEVREYERKSPLRVSKPLKGRGIGYDWAEVLEAGDCVIAFSRREIMRLRREIEMCWQGQMRCGVVYGAMPPPARTHQASLFNDPNNNMDVLVASDAVGMGLNLNIKRIIFSATTKYDGQRIRHLTDDEVKQIAGRAGRFGSIFPNGEATAMTSKDFQRIRRSIHSPPSVVKQAGLLPSYDHLVMCNTALNHAYGLAELVGFFEQNIQLHPDYFVCDCEGFKYVSAILADLDLSFQDRYMFCVSPVDVKQSSQVALLYRWASEVADGQLIRFPYSASRYFNYKLTDRLVQRLEELHSVADLYLWLAARCSLFVDRKDASTVQSDCCQLINMAYGHIHSRRSLKRFRKQRQQKEKEHRKNRRIERSKLRTFLT